MGSPPSGDILFYAMLRELRILMILIFRDLTQKRPLPQEITQEQHGRKNVLIPTKTVTSFGGSSERWTVPDANLRQTNPSLSATAHLPVTET